MYARGAAHECWIWNGGRSHKGYGMINGVSRRGDRQALYAHRVVYEALVGPIPDGLTIDHLCRNRACMNPAHMEPVTSRENTLRGFGPGAICARATHCLRGHPYDRKGKRNRWCSICDSLRKKAEREKAKVGGQPSQ